MGPDIDVVVKPEDEGLRITLPATREKNYPIVVMPALTLTGDFEITGAYELLAADRPTKGYGVGVNLTIATNEARDRFAKVSRILRAQEGSVYLTEFWKHDPKVYKASSVPSEVKAGQLRLVRAGATVRFLVADAPGNDFRVLAERDFGTEDVPRVGFTVADSGSPGNAVDARLVDLRIRFQNVAAVGVATKAPNADVAVPSADRGWLMAALLIGAAIVVFIGVGAGAAFFLWRRRPAGQTPVVSPLAGTEVASAKVTVACTSCGKKLRAKGEWAGRKVKCPQCGKAVAIPQ